MKLLTILLLALLTQQASANDDRRKLLKLDEEVRKLGRKQDPVDRTKAFIKIADLHLDLAGDAARREDFAAMDDRLAKYGEVVREAHKTMSDSRRDPHRKPAGFKDLEIAIRRQSRTIEDLGTLLSFDQRTLVEKTLSQITEVRGELMKLLFGK